MEIKKRKLNGTFEITLKPIEDNRGFFMRIYDHDIFYKYGINQKWIQENHSRSNRAGIIRGLHLQLPPFSEAKLVRCIRGKIWDVFVDLRYGSESFGHSDWIELSEYNNKMIFIPRGFAHGFCTLTEESEVIYKVDNYYSKENEIGIIWNDEELNIKWPIDFPTLSDKDRNNITFKEFRDKYKGIRI